MAPADDSHTHLQLALKAARQAAWSFDFSQGTGYRSPELQALLGVANDHPGLQDYLHNVHPADQPTVLQAFSALRTGQLDESDLQYRFVRDDGGVMWVEQHAYLERDAAGQPARLYGLTRDITRAKMAELDLQRLNATLEARVAERTQALEDERASLAAFVQFVQDSADAVTVKDVVQRASHVLGAVLGGVSVAYYQLQGGLWQVRYHSEDISETFLSAMRAGFSPETPRFAAAVARRQVNFLDTWNPASEQLPTDQNYHASAMYPYFVDGQPASMLSLGFQGARQWTEQDRAVIRAVGRALGLLLDRLRTVHDLEQANSDLLASNTELEAFTYSASHDLRTPVRHVSGFVDLLERSIEQPNDMTRRYAQVVRSAAERMNTLIDAMLLLSRAGRSDLQRTALDLEELVRHAQLDVRQEFPDRPVEWRVGALPTVIGDRPTLQQVLTNLLSNAVKYSGRQARSVVEVWAEEAPAEVTVYVRDNGAGFDPTYAHKLFGVFQRLHSEQDFPGTGVGLATVRRIVLRHGGQVWAEGQPGQGATFSFTLPKPAA